MLENQLNSEVSINLVVSISRQILSVYKGDTHLKDYIVSTAKNGIGSLEGSHCTPLGRHVIAAKIGHNMPMNSVFVGRVPTGEIYDSELGKAFPERDWILTRILWLAGCEPTINQGSNEFGCCDTFSRFIYIHGTPDDESMAEPLSHGCVRMRNGDIIDLFEEVVEGTKVLIEI